MKTKKRAAERIYSLTASFLSFSPDAKASGWRWNTAQPVGAAMPQPIRNIAIVFCNQVSACCGQSLRQPAAATSLSQGRLFRIPHAPAGNCLCYQPTTSAVGSRARPWCRGEAPQGLPSSFSGKLFELYASYFRSWVQGTTLAAIGFRAQPWFGQYS